MKIGAMGVVMILFAGRTLALPPAYEVTDLGLLDSTDSDSRALGLNNLGQVVGWSDYGTIDL